MNDILFLGQGIQARIADSQKKGDQMGILSGLGEMYKKLENEAKSMEFANVRAESETSHKGVGNFVAQALFRAAAQDDKKKSHRPPNFTGGTRGAHKHNIR